MPHDPEPVCVDILSDMVKSPIRTEAQSRRVLTQLTLCFIDSSRKVSRLDEKIYGDGNGRGMAGQVHNLSEEWKEIKPLMIQMMARAAEPEPKKPDGFQTFAKYIQDKILPPLIVSAIVGYAAFQMALYVFLQSEP